MPANVVVVESPAKAKTIEKYLGSDFAVLASYGHVRDLPGRDGSVRPDEDFAMSWEARARERGPNPMEAIARAVRGAKTVWLATDPDREGEAISWHIKEMLDQDRLLQGRAVRRVTFNAITRDSIRRAFGLTGATGGRDEGAGTTAGTGVGQARDLDEPLVAAYLARRALDYLVGFTLSPVLWRKLPGAKSAGRVQSVALRLICEREAEIEAFVSREYWSVTADLATASGVPFRARLVGLDGAKLDKFALGDRGAAEAAAARVRAAALHVARVESKQVRRNPAAPFITSTLQQEASRKLGFSAKMTMDVAQRLYEGRDLGGETVGLITYMRTDGVDLAPEAIEAARALILRDHGKDYLPAKPRIYKSAAKNAQEAHEAVRPTDMARRPADIARFLSPDEARLYELIWKRTVASQMESALLDQVTVELESEKSDLILRATGQVIRFDGFLALYQEDRDEPADDEEGGRLPPLARGDRPTLKGVTPEQHFTQPPPRYSDASLVKRLEELGIGRPSTYASIIQVLQDRGYVRIDKRRFVPEGTGRVVTTFLSHFFDRYVAYDFTAALEQRLDDVSAGELDYKTLLRDFWSAFRAKIEETQGLTITQVIDEIEGALATYLFPPREDGGDPRLCPLCREGRQGLRLGRMGPFLGCSRYPDCRYTRDIFRGAAEAGEASVIPLGAHPETGRAVEIRSGPYGWYIQHVAPAEAEVPTIEADAEAPPAKGKKRAAKPKKPPAPKPQRVSLPKGVNPESVDLSTALAFLSLPRRIGAHPETGADMLAGLGRFGPYVKHGDLYVSLPKDEDVLTIGMNRAVDLLAKGQAKAGRVLGQHPQGGDILLRSGRFGPYLQWGQTVANLPKGKAADGEGDPTLARAVALLAEKGKVLKPRGGARGRGAAAKGGKAAAKPAGVKRARPAQAAADATPAAKAKRGRAATAAVPEPATPPQRGRRRTSGGA